MGLNRRILRLVSGLAALLLSAVACNGSPSGGPQYFPSSTSGMSAPQSHLGILPNGEERGEILSSCGRHIRIKVAGILTCMFREPGYGDNSPFTIHDHTNGLISISPMSGNSDTKFTVTGLVIGSGFFVVRDNIGHHLRVTVRVIL